MTSSSNISLYKRSRQAPGLGAVLAKNLKHDLSQVIGPQKMIVHSS